MTLLADIAYQSNWIDILRTNFMRNAFTGGTLVAVAAGMVGYFVVIRRDSFAAHALAHIGFPGATGAVLVGVPVTLGLAVFCIGGGLAIGALGKRANQREVATGTVLAVATSLGVLFSSMAGKSASTVTSVLFGNLLAVSESQLVTFSVFTAALLVALAAVARPLLLASVNPDVAEAKGIPVRALGIVFTVMVAIVVVMAVQVVGTLLLFALVVTPAATALTLTARPMIVVAISTVISVVSVVIGLVLSAMFSLPPSFPIVAIAFACWLVALGFTRDDRRQRGGLRHGHGHHHGNEDKSDGHDHHHPIEAPSLGL